MSSHIIPQGQRKVKRQTEERRIFWRNYAKKANEKRWKYFTFLLELLDNFHKIWYNKPNRGRGLNRRFFVRYECSTADKNKKRKIINSLWHEAGR